MKKSEMVLKYIEDSLDYEYFYAQLQQKKLPGISGDDVQQALGIVRNNASTLLNQLHKSGRLVKIRTRPVRFLPAALCTRLANQSSLPILDSYSPEELFAAAEVEMPDPFNSLLGVGSSLKRQVEQAKAAIVYPPRGLHSLLLGESGVGKTTFAAAMHAYGLYARRLKPEEFPFVTFNCADYFHNPQLLLSQLFGHTKGAFTGAREDKPGLVEQADGGILFLDEVHRLPPEGQEMLFYLMDKGEFSRLGETSAHRRVKLLIICATTENPEGNLLATFIRRIPVTIYLPELAKKPVSERIELVEHFLRLEAMAIKRPLQVAPEVLKALAVYGFPKGNIGQLRSEIKLLCANAFLQSLEEGAALHIDYGALSPAIRDSLFHLSQLDKHSRDYLRMFTEPLIIAPDENTSLLESRDELYTQISDKATAMRKEGLASHEIRETLRSEIEVYFQDLTKNAPLDKDVRTLYKVIAPEIVDAAVALLDFARHHLQVEFKPKFIFGFCFHVQALLQRTNALPNLPIPPLDDIKAQHPKEFSIAKEMISRLKHQFHGEIRPYEQGFLALLLANNEANNDSAERIGIIICCHGESTASSMAAVANTLLNTSWMKAVDMPLDSTVEDTYSRLKSVAISMNRGEGLLLLVDMGSLTELGTRLQKETGIQVRVISNISTPIALELLRKVLYKTNSIDTIYQAASKPMLQESTGSSKMPAILSLCMTGEGASKVAYAMLKKILPVAWQDKLKIVVQPYLELEHRLPELLQQYSFLAVVGNIDPQLSLPFYQVGTLLDKEGRELFLEEVHRHLEGLSAPEPPPQKVQTVEDKAVSLLSKYVKYMNPHQAIGHLTAALEEIGSKALTDSQRLDLLIHMGCMLDRCLHGDAIYFEHIRDFIHANETLFSRCRVAISNLANKYDTKINDDEVCYIVKILNTLQ